MKYYHSELTIKIIFHVHFIKRFAPTYLSLDYKIEELKSDYWYGSTNNLV